jgi:hypothetical protein
MGKKVERMKNDKGCVEQILASPKPTWAKADGGDLGIGRYFTTYSHNNVLSLWVDQQGAVRRGFEPGGSRTCRSKPRWVQPGHQEFVVFCFTGKGCHFCLSVKGE